MPRPAAFIALLAVAVTGCARSAGETGFVAAAPAPAPPAAGPAAAPAPAAPRADTGVAGNPFLVPSPLPFHAPPFDRIHDADFKPAIEEGMRRQLAEVEAIANDPAAPTFENTIVAMERSGQMLTRAEKVFNALTGANTDDTLQAIETEESPRLAAHSDAIYLNARLFHRVKRIYDARASLRFASERTRLVEQYYRDFVRAGALLSDADKAKLRALNEEEAKLTTTFTNRLLAATKAGALVLDDSAQLAGLGAGEIAAAAAAAKERGLQGRWVLPLQNTTQQPAQASLANRAVRERLFRASTLRAERGDTDDTRATILRLAAVRAERARLLGFPDYAAYALQNQMAKTPAAAIKLLTDMVPAALAKAKGEASAMQALADSEKAGITLEPWDWQYYAEQVRKARYALDESQITPYFELDRVLRDGVFFAANRLYGLTFQERHDIPVYQPDVRVFEVYDADGKPLALWYCDYFKRDNKSGGAWEDSFVDQSGLMGTLPVVFNVANFTRPAPGQPALLTFDDVTTMFHEFGHALHAMFSKVEYPALAGTNVPRDFVEFPSQFNEHWALDPTVLAHYARRWDTGAPMPPALVAKIRTSTTFNQGFATMEYLAASLLDFGWHTVPAGSTPSDVDAFEAATLKRYGVDYPLVPPRYRSTYFAHIWEEGYAAGYYAYLWSEVLDDDAFAWFREHGGLTRRNGQRFRAMILSRGNTEDVAAAYRAFRGRDPSVQPLLEQRGLTQPGKPVSLRAR